MMQSPSPTILRQLSSFPELRNESDVDAQKEPTKYWVSNMTFALGVGSNGCLSRYTTERAAWLARERGVAAGLQVPTGTPFQQTREEVDASARKQGEHRVNIRDETDTIVEWWGVKPEEPLS